MNNILTIDGPSGVGKGTVARIMADKLGWYLLDSGAIYRAFALAVSNKNINTADEKALEQVAKDLNLEFKTKKGDELVSAYLDNKNVSDKLRLEKTGELASKLSSIGVVRSALLQKQKDFARRPGLVADGRDMGTVVFKNAAYKVFLTASSAERAKRRLKQLQRRGEVGIISQILADIEKRDERDKSRKNSPLKPAKDALIIDTTQLSIDEVITKVMTIVKV